MQHTLNALIEIPGVAVVGDNDGNLNHILKEYENETQAGKLATKRRGSPTKRDLWSLRNAEATYLLLKARYTLSPNTQDGASSH